MSLDACSVNGCGSLRWMWHGSSGVSGRRNTAAGPIHQRRTEGGRAGTAHTHPLLSPRRSSTHAPQTAQQRIQGPRPSEPRAQNPPILPRMRNRNGCCISKFEIKTPQLAP